MPRSPEALERFERQTAWPMLVLSLAILPLLIVPLVVDLSPGTESVIFALDWFIWAVFAVEYGIRLYLAPEKWTFIRGHVIDLIVVLVPFLRPLRIASSARMLRLLRLARVGVFVLRALEAVREVLTRHKLHYTLLIAGLVTVGGGLLVWELERRAPEANITSLPDALWWAVTTVTTVGYGDRFPTTAGGRGIATLLMLVGVGLFGLLAATLASFLIERGEEQRDEPAVGSDPRIDEVLERLDRIEQALERRHPPSE